MNSTATRRGLRIASLIAGILLIIGWQARFAKPDITIEKTYHLWASSGIQQEQQFFFFLYHLKLFPIATDAPIHADTKDEAIRLMREEPAKLKQDQGSTFRSGDRGRTYLYFVDAWFRHDAIHPSLVPAHAFAFIASLVGLFAAFWAGGRMLQGLLLVALLGSNPFQLFEVYRNENVFSWPITTMIAVLAINVPLLFRPGRAARPWYPWFAVVATGLLVSCIRNVRSEPTIIGASAVMVVATMSWLPKRRRFALVALMGVVFFLGSVGTRALLDRKFQRAAAAIEKVGGEPFTGPRYFYHEFWHAVWCGLGDFDTKYGYKWNDYEAFKYVVPRLQLLHPEVQIPIAYSVDRFYDKAHKYPVFIGELGGYHEIARDKIVSDVKRDPGWFVDILKKRADRILSEATPVGIAFKEHTWRVSGSAVGWLWIPLFAFVLATRRWAYAKLMAFSVPLSTSAMILYSDRGIAWYSTFHIFGVFVLLLLVAEGAKQWFRRRRALAV